MFRIQAPQFFHLKTFDSLYQRKYSIIFDSYDLLNLVTIDMSTEVSLPNSLISSVNTAGSDSMRHHDPSASVIIAYYFTNSGQGFQWSRLSA